MIFTDGSLYCFQVSSFRSKGRAEKEAERFRRMGANAFVVKVNLPNLSGTWYRVRIGYFNSLSEAQREKAKIVR